MMLDGIRKLAPTGVMLLFAILYFAVMIDTGLFDPAVRWILKLVKGDPLKVAMGTVFLTLVVSLDGDGSTTYMICVAAMFPLYKRLGMNPLIMTCLMLLSSGVMNLTPWGGPTARRRQCPARGPGDVFVPMIAPMLLAIAWLFFLAYLYGRSERARLGILQIGETEGADVTVSQCAEARRPHLRWFNGLLTLALMAALVVGILPMPVLFMIAFGIAMTVNYRCLNMQKQRIAAHAENVLAVVSLIFAAGIFTGILSGTGMVDAMSKGLLAVIPDALGPYMAVITALVSLPFTFFISNDAFYFGRAAGAGRGRRGLWHQSGGDRPGLHRRSARAPAQPPGALDLPAGGPGQGGVRRPPALHPEMGDRDLHVPAGRCFVTGCVSAVQPLEFYHLYD